MYFKGKGFNLLFKQKCSHQNKSEGYRHIHWILKLVKLLLKIIIGTKKILESFISSVPNKKHLQPPG